jgi:hypothetical protein
MPQPVGPTPPERKRGPQPTIPTSGHASAGPMPPVRPTPASGGQRTPLATGNPKPRKPAPRKAGQSEQNRIAIAKGGK